MPDQHTAGAATQGIINLFYLSLSKIINTKVAFLIAEEQWAIVEETLTSGKYISLFLISILYIYINTLDILFLLYNCDWYGPIFGN